MMFARLALTASLIATANVPANDVGTEAMVQRATHVCAACHGEGGRGAAASTRNAASTPSLAGQMPQYVVAQLKDFRGQTRAESDSQAYMWGISALLDDATIQGLADYYSSQTPASPKPGNAQLVAAGRKIFDQGIPARAVRACASCHGSNAEGASVFPRLAGQNADYIFLQLKVFGTRLRPHGVLMKDETAKMSATQMRAVAEYVQSR